MSDAKLQKVGFLTSLLRSSALAVFVRGLKMHSLFFFFFLKALISPIYNNARVCFSKYIHLGEKGLKATFIVVKNDGLVSMEDRSFQHF